MYAFYGFHQQNERAYLWISSSGCCMSSRRTVKNRNATSFHFRELRPSSSSGTLFANLPAYFVTRLAPFRYISEDKKLTEARISIPLVYFVKRTRWYRELSGYLNLVYTYTVTDESIETIVDFFMDIYIMLYKTHLEISLASLRDWAIMFISK